MRMKSLLSAGLGALALGLVATSAQAAPAGGNLVAAVERDTSDDRGLVQKVHRYYYGYGDYYRPYYRYRSNMHRRRACGMSGHALPR